MKRSEIHILLIEDDTSLGKAMQEALKRSGYEVRWCTNPTEALNSARQTDFKVAIVDCLLPKSNGVELSMTLKSVIGDDLKLILISGIYRDKSFTKEALQKTNAHAFLTKPFELEKLATTLEEMFSSQLEADLPPLLDSLTRRDLAATDRLKALEGGVSIHGYELPLVYSLVFGANLTGQLNVVSSDGAASILWFHGGRLTQVQIQDKTSYFGVLLVEMGFTTPEEVEEVLAQRNERPIGERLVAAHSLSPHAIRIVREEQMMIRLSKTVQDTFVDATFTPSDVSATDVSLDRERFTRLCWDWICSKMSADWLKGFYNQWLEYPVVLADRAMIQRRLAQIPGLENDLNEILRVLGEGRPLSDAIDSGQIGEDHLLPLLYLLLLEKLAYFGLRRASREDAVRRIKRIKRMLAESVNKDYFQLLGVSPRAVEREINKNYIEMVKNFHPDRVEPTAPAELRQVTEQFFARITAAYETLKDPGKRAAYAREVQEGSAEKILHNEGLFEQGQASLRKGKYQMALDTFAKLAGQKHHRNDVNIFLAWAKMKVGAPDQKIEKFLKSIGETINKVPPEERHSAPYFYTKGLFYMQIGDLEKAKTNFKHALVMDPNFMEARRDLTVTRSKMRQQAEAYGDFSTVVTKIFGRRKSR